MGKLMETVATIDVKEAAQKAKKYLLELSEESLDSVRLEEIERTDKSWFITFSYTTPDGIYLKYKKIELDIETGEFVAMKIRTLN